MLENGDTVFGIELLSSGITKGKPVVIWLVRDKKGKIFSCSKRKITPLGLSKKQHLVAKAKEKEIFRKALHDLIGGK